MVLFNYSNTLKHVIYLNHSNSSTNFTQLLKINESVSTFGFSFKCEMPNSEDIEAAGFGQDAMQRLPRNIHEIARQGGPQQTAIA